MKQSIILSQIRFLTFTLAALLSFNTVLHSQTPINIENQPIDYSFQEPGFFEENRRSSIKLTQSEVPEFTNLEGFSWGAGNHPEDGTYIDIVEHQIVISVLDNSQTVTNLKLSAGTRITLTFGSPHVSIFPATINTTLSTVTNPNNLQLSFSPDRGTLVMEVTNDITLDFVNGEWQRIIIDINPNDEDVTLPVLPVSFGAVEAYVSNNTLEVSWKTLMEKNNDHFEIEASADGKAFTSLVSVNSKTLSGTTDKEIVYSFSVTLPAVLGTSLLMLFGLGTSFRRRKWGHCAAITILSGFLIIGCTKGVETIPSGWEKIYVRIAQIDKDGTKKYSKTIVANKK